jgi:DNA-binding response OmpR family regulator
MSRRFQQCGVPVAKLLVIDDNPSLRRMMHRALENAGHEVLDAENGERGLELLRTHGADLVITDIMMPEKDGIETIRELHETSPDTRILAISGGGMLHELKYLHMASAFGADATLAKPLRIGELLATVERLLGANVVAGALDGLKE